MGTTKSGSFRKSFGRGGAFAWTFRARSREDMMEWWNDVRMLCARYLVASEQMERSGPVAAVVRAAGYVSEEEEEEEEGSSVEEEEEADPNVDVDDLYEEAGEDLPGGYLEKHDVRFFIFRFLSFFLILAVVRLRRKRKSVCTPTETPVGVVLMLLVG